MGVAVRHQEIDLLRDVMNEMSVDIKTETRSGKIHAKMMKEFASLISRLNTDWP